MAKKAMENINKKEFGNLDKEKQEHFDKCVICFEDFKDTDEIAELNCDAHHIFHQECIQKWLETNMVCPNCR